MKLFMVEVLHASPKDNHRSVEAFLVAQTDEEVMYHIDQNFNYRAWQNDDEQYPVYEDDEQIGLETRLERVLRLQGDINDEDYDFSDAYYGITLYGWKVIAENFRIDPAMPMAILEGLMSSGKLEVIAPSNIVSVRDN